MKYAIRITDTKLFVQIKVHTAGRGQFNTYSMLLTTDMLDATLYSSAYTARHTMNNAKAKEFGEVVAIDGAIVSIVPEPAPVKPERRWVRWLKDL